MNALRLLNTRIGGYPADAVAEVSAHPGNTGSSYLCPINLGRRNKAHSKDLGGDEPCRFMVLYPLIAGSHVRNGLACLAYGWPQQNAVIRRAAVFLRVAHWEYSPPRVNSN